MVVGIRLLSPRAGQGRRTSRPSACLLDGVVVVAAPYCDHIVLLVKEVVASPRDRRAQTATREDLVRTPEEAWNM